MKLRPGWRDVFSSLLCIGAMWWASIPLAQSQPAKGPVYTFYYWENVGTIVEINKSSLVLRRSLSLSENSWSMERGAVSKASDLDAGDRIFAQGKTVGDGSFSLSRIYLTERKSSDSQPVQGENAARSSDFGGPEGERVPGVLLSGGDPVGKGGGNIPGADSRIPPPGRPGDKAPGNVDGLQDPRGSHLTRYNSWDADGIIESIAADKIILTQLYWVDKETQIFLSGENKLSLKELHPGMRVAVTVKDKMNEKTRAIKAQIIRVLPME
jgi:hypothetical protein